VRQVSEFNASKGLEGEQILRWISCSGMRSGFFELVLTSNRMIIAKTGNGPHLSISEVIHEAVESDKKEAELQKLSPEEILFDNPENVSIPYSDIFLIEMKRPGFLGVGNIKILVRGIKKPYWFDTPVARRHEFQGHVDFLLSVLKDRVIAK